VASFFIFYLEASIEVPFPTFHPPRRISWPLWRTALRSMVRSYTRSFLHRLKEGPWTRPDQGLQKLRSSFPPRLANPSWQVDPFDLFFLLAIGSPLLEQFRTLYVIRRHSISNLLGPSHPLFYRPSFLLFGIRMRPPLPILCGAVPISVVPLVSAGVMLDVWTREPLNFKIPCINPFFSPRQVHTFFLHSSLMGPIFGASSPFFPFPSNSFHN